MRRTASAQAAAAAVKPMLSEEERVVLRGRFRQRQEESRAFLERQLQDLKARAEEAKQRMLLRRAGLEGGRLSVGTGTTVTQMESSLLDLPGEGGEGGSSIPTTAKFYRVARTAVAGKVDGWGWGTIPSALTNLSNANVIVVSASPRDSGVHSLALRGDGSAVAWGNNYLWPVQRSNESLRCRGGGGRGTAQCRLAARWLRRGVG